MISVIPDIECQSPVNPLFEEQITGNFHNRTTGKLDSPNFSKEDDSTQDWRRMLINDID